MRTSNSSKNTRINRQQCRRPRVSQTEPIHPNHVDGSVGRGKFQRRCIDTEDLLRNFISDGMPMFYTETCFSIPVSAKKKAFERKLQNRGLPYPPNGNVGHCSLPQCKRLRNKRPFLRHVVLYAYSTLQFGGQGVVSAINHQFARGAFFSQTPV